ncbi:MAG: phosphopantetheine-binding protein [Hyphomicrobiales bacterium]
MSESATSKRVLELLNAHMEAGSRATLDTKLLADTTMDSVKVMNLLLELEEEFNITIPLNNLAEAETVGDLIEEIEKL